MRGFQAKTVTAVRSQHVVCVVRVSELRAKAFQIGFDKDGSLFIHFPYFQHRTASSIHITRMAGPTFRRTGRYSQRLNDNPYRWTYRMAICLPYTFRDSTRSTLRKRPKTLKEFMPIDL